MPLVLNSGPTLEPITLAETKQHLRVDTTADDLYIAAAIAAARVHVEHHIGGALITQSWSLFTDALPPGAAVRIPITPVAALTAVRLHRPDGTIAPLPTSHFQLDAASSPPRLLLRETPTLGALRPANGIEFVITVGFGANPSDVPAPIRQAMLLLVAAIYEHRDPHEFAEAHAPLPPPVAALLAPWRHPHLL